MPLLPGKNEIGHNIEEMEKAGHPHAQAVAAALQEALDANKGGPDTHAMRRYVKGVQAEEQAYLNSPQYKADQAAAEAMVKKLAAERAEQARLGFVWRNGQLIHKSMLKDAKDAAAGVLLTHGNRALFLKRSDKSRDHQGEWCCPGGSLEDGETPEQAAARELQEETGITGLLTGDFTKIDEGDGFVTFRQNVDTEATPTLNDEHTEAMWAPMNDPPKPLHPGVAATLRKMAEATMDADEREKLERRYLEIKSQYGSKTYGKMWKPTTPLPIKVEFEELVKKLTKRGASDSAQDEDEALDRREWDTNGWFEVPDNPLSTIGVYQYSEASVVKGGDRNKLVGVYRPAEELSDPETVKSFRLMPWTDDHPVSLLGESGQDLVPAEQKGVHGVIGEQTYYKDGALYGNIKIFSEELARKIAGGKRELSCGYRCDFVPCEGVYNGVPYQYVQKNLRGNHVASVRAGRMGAAVRVLDAAEVGAGSFAFALDLKETEAVATDAEAGLAAQDAWKPVIIEKKKGPNGGTYRLQRRGDKWDVAWQDAYGWKYKSGLKGVSEQEARTGFQLATMTMDALTREDEDCSIGADADQSALNAAARGLRMASMSTLDLQDLIKEFSGKDTQAAKDIVAAAKQILAAKRRMGARDGVLEESDRLDAEYRAASAELRKFPAGAMGLHSDEVRADPAFKAAKQKVDKAFAALRDFNGRNMAAINAARKVARKAKSAQDLSDTLTLMEKGARDGVELLIGQLVNRGYSKGVATKVAGKVAAAKGLDGHQHSLETIMPKARANDADKDLERDDMADDAESAEQEEMAKDAEEEIKDAEEEKADEKDESKEAKDRARARDRRAGARDARRSARDRARDARDAKAAQDAAARAAGKGMDEAAVSALVAREVATRVAAQVAEIGPNLRREAAAKDTLYRRLSPVIGAFDHAEMTLPAMAAYGLQKLGAPQATDPVVALDYLLVGRSQAAPGAVIRGAGQDASASTGNTFVDKYIAA